MNEHSEAQTAAITGEQISAAAELHRGIAVWIDGPIAHLQLARPEKLNAINTEILYELPQLAKRLKKDRRVRAVVLSAQGREFSAGIDIGDVFGKPANIARGMIAVPFRHTNAFQEAFWALRKLPVPVIAAMHGRAYGAGAQLALAADIRIARPDIEMSIMEAKWGLIPDMSGSVALAQLVGIDVAKRLTMTAEKVSGTRAKDYGLVTELSDDPLRDAVALANEIATRSPDSVAAAKRLLDRVWQQAPGRAFGVERRLQIALILGRNSKIARSAGFKKQTPRFGPRQFWK